MTSERAARIALRRARAYGRLADALSPLPGLYGPRRAREYTRLFVAPRPQVYPYESMYRDPCPRVTGDSTLDVLRRYRAAGFRLPTDWRDLPDHIAVELLFMRSLADAEAEGWRREEPDSARGVAGEERQFVEDHLLPWVPEFCAAVAQASRLPCFRRATGDLRELLPRDHDWLLALTAGVP